MNQQLETYAARMRAHRTPSTNKSGMQSPVARQVIQAAAERHGVRVGDVMGASQRPEFVKPRCEVARILRRRGWTTTRIGWALGGRHHTTILY